MSRATYAANKIGWATGTILIVLVLNFFLFRVLPGDPARSGVKDPRLTAEAQEGLRQRFGLDLPVLNCFVSINPVKLGPCWVNPLETQFGRYLTNLVTGNFGISYHSGRPVAEELANRLASTVLLIGAGQIFAIVLGMSLGIVAAWKSGTALDYAALGFSLVAWSLPTFWLGIILLFWGSTHLGLPMGGRSTPGAVFATPGDALMDTLRHMFLPTLTYTIIFLGEYMLIMRSSLLDVLSEDYILTAKAKGLNNLQILKDHALRNALLPMVTIIALNLGFTVAGALQIETVFSWPGLGGAIYEAVQRRDYPMLQGAFLLLAISVVIANTLADLLYLTLDPRVKA